MPSNSDGPAAGGEYRHVVPRPAATVVLVREAPSGLEVLMTRRPSTMAFAPDLHVFPGGATDPDDGDPRTTAARELFEEAGILLADAEPDPMRAAAARTALLAGRTAFADVLARLGIRLRPDDLVPLSRWVTPPVLPRRYDTRIYAARLPDGAEASFEGDEVADHAWTTPAGALGRLAAGEWAMWLPTTTTLQRLEHAPTFAAIAEHLGVGEPDLPDVTEVAPDVVRIRQPAGAGVDGLEVSAYLVGGREAVVIDGGDPSEEALLAIVEAATAGGATIGAVALTSADPDHAGGAEHLREGLGVLVHGGAGAGRPLPFPVGELGDGDPVPAGDVRLVAIPAPGPRPDHVVYWLASSRSAFVGDLVGPPPARSIPGPSDRAAWGRSLARIAALGAERLLPAHGDPVEGPVAVAAAIVTADDALGASRPGAARRGGSGGD